MITRSLPAGLLNSDVEFFNDPENLEHAYYLTDSQARRVMDAPADLKDFIRNDIANHPVKAEALVEIGYEGDIEQLEKYISCVSGAFDGDSDIINGKLQHTEYWPCPHRGICPVEGRLCNALIVGPDNTPLTRREIDVLTLIAQGLLNKEIADRLNVSEETVKVHIKHILTKTGLNNRTELAVLAHKKNLIS